MTDKQAQFVAEYLVDCNATQAAIRAGYSKKTAYSIGQRLMKSEEIQRAIQAGMNDRQERITLTQDYVIDNLREIVTRCMSEEDFECFISELANEPEYFDAMYYACENGDEMLADQEMYFNDLLIHDERNYYAARMGGYEI